MESPLRRPPGLTLVETLRWQPDGFVRLPAHLARLAASAAALGIPCDRSALDRALAGVAGSEPRRVRLTLALDGTVAVTSAPLGPPKAVWTVRIARERLDPTDPWLRLKSSERRHHDAARAALPTGRDEALLLNSRGEVCEGTITNVFADLGAGLVTPPLACGLLPGVLRAELLARGECREAVLTVPALRRARLLVGNSLRGLIPARLAD